VKCYSLRADFYGIEPEAYLREGIHAHGSQMDMSDTRTDSILARAPHRIGKVTLAVRDLSTVSRFYRDVIGLAVIETNPDAVRLGTANSVLLELRHEPGARARSPREAGLFHTAFLLPSRADLGAWTAHAAERRFPLHGAADHRVSEALYLSDPEGNGIEIYADRPSATWPRAGRMIEMPSDPLDLQDLVRAAAGRRWSGIPQGSTVGHMHLQVGAIPEAETFYADLLGFEITCRYPGGSFYGSGGYHHQLATNIWNSRGTTPRTDITTGLAHFEIVAANDDVVEAARERLTRAGYALAEGESGLQVKDPWGTSMSLGTAF
jgi:catechol 2,3-dioxygenase